MRIHPERSRMIFNNPPKPTNITESQFDHHDDEIKRIGALDYADIIDHDFWYYFHDLSYVELQKDLFNYLFPACLNFWYQTLMRNDSTDIGNAEFHKSLHHGDILRKMTTKEQTEAIYSFFHDGFIDRIEMERGFMYCGSKTPAYSFIQRFNSLGYIAPIINTIWSTWWELDTPGKAVSAIMYASGLIYLRGENPIFGERTPEGGGGDPCLTESDAMLYDESWLPENIDFIKNNISTEYIQKKMQQASELLCNEPEGKVAAIVARDAMKNGDTITLRIDDLITGLSNPSTYACWNWD